MRVGIALGSNVGDRAAHLRNAVRALKELGEPPFSVSRAYETAPVDCPPGSGDFLNAAMEIGWEADIHELLEQLQSLEQAFGRPAVRLRNSPRPLDLDILYATGVEVNEPDLVLPHPRMFERAFVLKPLHDILPHLRPHPGRPTISEALFALSDSQIEKVNLTQIIID